MQMPFPELSNLLAWVTDKVYYIDLMFEVPHFHRFISQIEQLKNLNQATVQRVGLALSSLAQEVAIRVWQALEELAMEKVAEVLPTLQTRFFKELQPSGPVHETIEKFVTARRLSGRPIAVDRWGELQH
ncbi:hypothetical protein F5148DRAFT_1154927 [Russula earlei]|uniref:Uncharacterized protein n=1 Tax=Russula earlei TaxID=71964 RepID=A0ACC0TT19_9AGAM|nr:hypothetical protein F5148DRAFT_1154927 [Russula earlei]